MTLQSILTQLEAFAQNPDYSFDDRLEGVLQSALEALNLNIGIISHIVGKTYTVEFGINPDNNLTGAEFRLGDTYCSITVKRGDVLCIEHMGVSEWFRHPAYEMLKLETYIGMPITVQGKLYGTVNFTCSSPYHAKFTPAQKDFVKAIGEMVGLLIEERDSARALAS